jgi:hypothetical protein
VYFIHGLSCPGFVVSRVCRVQGLWCPGLVVSRVCRVLGLSVTGFVVSRVCRAQGLSCPGIVGYRVCRVQGLSCPGFVMSRIVVSMVCVPVQYTVQNIIWILTQNFGNAEYADRKVLIYCTEHVQNCTTFMHRPILPPKWRWCRICWPDGSDILYRTSTELYNTCNPYPELRWCRICWPEGSDEPSWAGLSMGLPCRQFDLVQIKMSLL